ncbi:hypothetical protein FRC02_005160 [Tulasnella sp. 418]|nr:hypothetical protein FRC02_005160 [Tulasnella sp. 418]
MPPFAFDPYPRTVSCAPRNTSGHSSRQRKSSIPSSLKRQACPSTPVRSLPDTQIKHTPASTVASSIPTPSHKPLLLSPP